MFKFKKNRPSRRVSRIVASDSSTPSAPEPKRFLVKHVGNMGDMVFFVPPVLEILKKKYPECHITFITAWGYKKKGNRLTITRGKWGLPRITRKAMWGERNQSGFCIALMMTNPHIDQLVHYHDTALSLEGDICKEEGKSFPTWSRKYYEQQKRSGEYDGVFELDAGLTFEEDPMKKMINIIGLPEEYYTNYKLYLTEEDKKVAADVMKDMSHPRIVLLESIENTTTRSWDPEKVKELENAIHQKYGVKPIWFGGKYSPKWKGKPLTLRQNIATLTLCDVGIGVMSGPLHFAAAVGLPTITLFCDHPPQRLAPSYFLNPYISDTKKQHRTLLGPTGPEMKLLKEGTTFVNLTPAEIESQDYVSWQEPGRQSTKSCLAVITVDEVMTVLEDVIPSKK